MERIGSDEEESKVHARIVKKNPKKKKIATVACMRRLGVRMRRTSVECQGVEHRMTLRSPPRPTGMEYGEESDPLDT